MGLPTNRGRSRSDGSSDVEQTAPRLMLWRWLSDADELRLLAWAGCALILLGWADATLQNVSETLFLKRVGVEWLPVGFLASSFLLVATTYALGALAARGDRTALLPRTYALCAVGVALVALVLGSQVRGAFVTLLLLSKQVKAVGLLMLWLAMGDIVNAQQAKRMFAPLMAALTLGAIAGSFSSGPLGASLGLERLVLVAAAALAASAALTLPTSKMRLLRLERGFAGATPGTIRDRGPRAGGFDEPLPSVLGMARDNRLFRILAIATTCSGLLGPMLYFQFSFVADAATTGSAGEQRLLALYAQFWGWTNVVVFVTQLAVAARLYRFVGIPAAMAASPIAYLAGQSALAGRMSLAAGLTTVAATRITDHAVHDPALPILYQLFPDQLRARATALLEGPIKRVASGMGNVVVLAVLALGTTAHAVAYIALPIALAWTVVAIVLWRNYPDLLIAAGTASRGPLNEGGFADLLDRGTVRALASAAARQSGELGDAAIEMIRDAEPQFAVAALATLATDASGPTEATRESAIAALAEVVHRNVDRTEENPVAAAALERCLLGRCPFSDELRVKLVQAYGRLRGRGGGETGLLAEVASRDESAAVRLAACALLSRASSNGDSALTAVLAAAVDSKDPLLANTAVEELRASLLCNRMAATWNDRLHLLVAFAQHPESRVRAIRALGDVALADRAAVRPIAESVATMRHDADVRVRAAALTFIGNGGLTEHAAYLAERLGCGDEEEADAARSAVLAIGPAAIEPLLAQYWFGPRHTRDAILDIVRRLQVDTQRLEQIYEREVDVAARSILLHQALSRHDPSGLLLQRLRERVDEGLHSVLLLIAAIEDRPRIARIAALLRRSRVPSERSILVEALDSQLTAQQQSRLIPLLDGRGMAARAAWATRLLKEPIPSLADARSSVLADHDELTRWFALSSLAPEACSEEDRPMLSQVDVALHLRTIPLFDRLTTRQLMEVAALAREEDWPAGAELFAEGDFGDAMYLIVDGRVTVIQSGNVLADLGSKDFFGELALFDDDRRSAAVVTKTAVRLLRLGRNDVLSLMEESPAVAIEICRSLARRLRHVHQRV